MEKDEIDFSNHSRPAFLLNLTKGGKPFHVNDLRSFETWSIRHKQANVGDEVYLLKPEKGMRNLEKSSRGIVGRGEIIRAPYPCSEALQFPLGWVTAQTTQWVVDVRIDEIIDSAEESSLTLAELGLIHPPASLWHRQPNGLRIPEDVAEVIRNSRQWKIAATTKPEIEPEELSKTSYKALVETRIGQQRFREKLLQFWEGCSVTGCIFQEVLVASHIVPWSKSSNKERLDVYNGLLLTPNLDSLFDNHLISFNQRGELLISKSISCETMSQLGIDPSMKLRRTEPQLLHYLKRHEDEFYEKQNRGNPEESSLSLPSST